MIYFDVGCSIDHSTPTSTSRGKLTRSPLLPWSGTWKVRKSLCLDLDRGKEGPK